MTSPFVPGDRVDVLIRGARFEWQGDHEVDVYLPGVEDPISVRTVDDDGEPLDDVLVGHHVPTVRPSDVWRARNGTLFFGVQHHDDPVQLATGDNRAFDPKAVVEHWGPLDLITSAADETVFPSTEVPPAPHPDAMLLSAVDVQVGNQIFQGNAWHRVLGAEQPANEGDEYVRFYTHYTPLRGLLFRNVDDLWVRRGDDTPLFDDAGWSGFLRPDTEAQPGDKTITLPTVDAAAPAVLVDEQVTTTEQEPAR